MDNPHKNTGVTRIIKAFTYSVDGIKSTFVTEAAFRQLAFVSVVLIPLALVIAKSKVELVLLIGVCILSLIIELLNSAIEAAIDRVSLELHPLSKKAKDAGSAAQFLAILLIVTVWVIIVL